MDMNPLIRRCWTLVGPIWGLLGLLEALGLQGPAAIYPMIGSGVAMCSAYNNECWENTVGDSLNSCLEVHGTYNLARKALLLRQSQPG